MTARQTVTVSQWLRTLVHAHRVTMLVQQLQSWQDS